MHKARQIKKDTRVSSERKYTMSVPRGFKIYLLRDTIIIGTCKFLFAKYLVIFRNYNKNISMLFINRKMQEDANIKLLTC
jgi:hypothetical protein